MEESELNYEYFYLPDDYDYFDNESLFADVHGYSESYVEIAERQIKVIVPPLILLVALLSNVGCLWIFLRITIDAFPSAGFFMVLSLFDVYRLSTECFVDWYQNMYG